MASSYPGGLDTLATNKTNSTTATTDHPNHHNDLADAVNKIEAELGTDPSGALDATVKDRFLVNESLIDRARRRFELYDDFMGQLSGTAVGAPFTMVTNGSGASTNQVTIPDSGSAGVIDGSTGTTNTGRTAIRTPITAGLLFGGGRARYATRVRLPTLSDATERYAYRAGFGDTDATAHTDGAYFEYDESVSANWRCVTANGATRTTTDSGVAVAATTWYRLEVDVNAAGTSVEFRINGSVVATTTTNIPTAAGREFGIGSWIVKSAGTTSRTAQIDYLGASVEFTTPR